MFVITAFDDRGNRVWHLELFSGVAAITEAAEMKIHRPNWIVEVRNPNGDII